MNEELGSGPLDADVWVIGRDYGTQEAMRRAPFVGPAGQLLDRALSTTGWRRKDMRIDNVVPRQPPGNDWNKHRPEDLQWGLDRLYTLLAKHQPKLIITLGNEASRAVVGAALDVGIQEARGYLWDSQFGRVLTTLHPAGIMRDWTPGRALFDLDLRKAKRELEAGCPALPHCNVTVVTDKGDLNTLTRALVQKFDRTETMKLVRSSRVGGGWGLSADTGLLAVDIENTEDLRLACMGFAPQTDAAWVIPAVRGWQMEAIARLAGDRWPKVLQNGQYDRYVAKYVLPEWQQFEIKNQVFDTQLAWHALQPELAGRKMDSGGKPKGGNRRTVKSLKFLASIFSRQGWWKDYDFVDETERYELCGIDCCVTLEVAEHLQKQLELP